MTRLDTFFEELKIEGISDIEIAGAILCGDIQIPEWMEWMEQMDCFRVYDKETGECWTVEH